MRRSTSPDAVVARDLPEGASAGTLALTDLRSGGWTRLGSDSVLGDVVTETVLGEIAERARSVARAQGYASGWAEGRRAALARADEEAEEVRRAAEADRARRKAEQRSALLALEAAVETMREQVEHAVTSVSDQAVDVALELARAVLGREVATATNPGADAIRRAMSQVDPRIPATVRLNPADRAALDQAVLGCFTVALVDDPALSRGDAIVETDDTLIDATVGAALERVREVLTR